MVVAALAACHDSPSAPKTADLQLALQIVMSGLENPDYLTAPDGDARLFVVERSGRILIVKNGALLPTPFLDIRSRVNYIGERDCAASSSTGSTRPTEISTRITWT